MNVWAIADLHLSFARPERRERDAARWRDHAARIEARWREAVQPADLVLLPGDLSMARNHRELQPDLAWLDALPGTKVISAGNHDSWWNGVERIRPLCADRSVPSAATRWKSTASSSAGRKGQVLLFAMRPRPINRPSSITSWANSSGGWNWQPGSEPAASSRSTCSGTIHRSMPMAGLAPGWLVSRKPAFRCVYTVIFICEASGRVQFRETFAAYATTVLRPMPSVFDHFASAR